MGEVEALHREVVVGNHAQDTGQGRVSEVAVQRAWVRVALITPDEAQAEVGELGEALQVDKFAGVACRHVAASQAQALEDLKLPGFTAGSWQEGPAVADLDLHHHEQNFSLESSRESLQRFLQKLFF